MPQNQPIRFIGLPAVIKMTGLCRTSIYTISDFPKPVKIKGAEATAQGGSRWVEQEVIDWMQSRITVRDTQPKPVDHNLFRGRPSKIEQAEAKQLHLSIRELRAQQPIRGV